MTARLGILLLIGLLVPRPAVAAGPSPEERARHIDLMTGILREADVRKFMDRVKSEGWQCPIIGSAWRLRERTPVEERVAGSAARSLGKQAMIAIDAQRDSIWSRVPSETQGPSAVPKVETPTP